MSVLSLLGFLIVFGLVFWCIRAIAGAFQIPPPIVTVIFVVLVIVGGLYLMQMLGIPVAGPLRLR